MFKLSLLVNISWLLILTEATGVKIKKVRVKLELGTRVRVLGFDANVHFTYL